MVSWWVPYLAKGRRTDFNTGPRDNSNCVCILNPQRLFESDSNNGPSLGQCNLGQIEDSSVQAFHQWSPTGYNIWPGPRPEFNNGPGITRIGAALLLTGVYSSRTRIMAPLQAIPILVKWKILLFRCPLVVSW